MKGCYLEGIHHSPFGELDFVLSGIQTFEVPLRLLQPSYVSNPLLWQEKPNMVALRLL